MGDTSDTTDAVPTGLTERMLDAFGLQWTNIAVLSGVVFTTFGLDPYLNAGIWAITVIAALSIVYIFRRQISPNFARYAAWSGLFLGLSLLGAWLTFWTSDTRIDTYLERNRNPSTLLLASAIGFPLGVCVLSYRKQEGDQLADLPGPLAVAVRENVTSSDFYHDGVDYVIELNDEGDGTVVLTYEVTLRPVNRTSRTLEYRDVFDPAGVDDIFLHAIIDGTVLDVNDPDYTSGRGLVLARKIEPQQSSEWMVKGRSHFSSRDSELFGAYIPATSISIVVKAPPSTLRVVLRSHLPEKVDPEILDNGDVAFAYHKGILPFQGARLFWQPVSAG